MSDGLDALGWSGGWGDPDSDDLDLVGGGLPAGAGRTLGAQPAKRIVGAPTPAEELLELVHRLGMEVRQMPIDEQGEFVSRHGLVLQMVVDLPGRFPVLVYRRGNHG